MRDVKQSRGAGRGGVGTSGGGRLASLALVAVAAVALSLGASGCRNACQKGAAQVVSCLEEYCDGNPDNTRCSEDAVARVSDLVRTNARECTDEMAAAIPADNSCENILIGLGYAPPREGAGEAHGEEH
jgi:hypothetical protein